MSKQRIVIKNIYYMLSYAFSDLKKNNFESIASEDFDHIEDLLAEILYKGISALLKRGLYKEYVSRVDNLPLLRGKIEVNGTIGNRIQRKNLISCEYDELTENNLHNQILRATILLLIRSHDVHQRRKRSLRSILSFFSEIDDIDINYIRWKDIKYQRANQSYKLVINICRFIINGKLLSTSEGEYKVISYKELSMSRLYEKFILEYYRYHYPQLHANADKVEWDLNVEESQYIDNLPRMQTDITLRKGKKVLIIDAKFYGHMMQEQFGKKSIHSNNIYQIFTYVKNKDTEHDGTVTGLLLYAKTQEEIEPRLDTIISNNRIMVDTLDLSRQFSHIRTQLDSFARILDSQKVGGSG